jgi:hypothetical protein
MLQRWNYHVCGWSWTVGPVVRGLAGPERLLVADRGVGGITAADQLSPANNPRSFDGVDRDSSKSNCGMR